MGCAVFVALDKDVEFETYTNGKFIANEFDEFIDFCNKNKIKSFDDYLSQDVGELLELMDDFEVPEFKELWFEASDGIEWIETVETAIKTQTSVLCVDKLLSDLSEYKEILLKANEVGAKWHLEMDI